HAATIAALNPLFPVLCIEALDSAGGRGPPVTAAVIAGLLEHRDVLQQSHRGPEVRRAAAGALGRSNDPAAEGVLLGLLEDSEVAGAAIDALALAGTPAAVEPLRRCADSFFSGVSGEAAA